MKKICTFVILMVSSFILCAGAEGKTPDPSLLNNIYQRAYEQYADGDFREAAGVFSDYLKAADKGDERIPDFYFYLGNIYRYALKYERARSFYWKIISDYPASSINMRAQFYVARSYDEDGEFYKALEYYNNIAASDTADDNIRRMSEDMVKNIAMKRLDSKSRERAVSQLPPSDALKAAYLDVGRSYLAAGRYKDAANVFEKMKMTDFSQEAEYYLSLAALKGEFPGAKIGVMLPLTGKYSKLGNDLYNSITMMHEYNNERLKKGRKAVIIRADTCSDPDKIPELYEKLVKKGVNIVIGPVQSQAAESLKPYVEKYKVPVMFLVASDDNIPLKSRYYFRNSIRHDDETLSLADYGVRKLRLTNFAVLVPDDEKGISCGKTFQKRVETYNAVLPVFATYKKGDTTYTDQLKMAQSSFVEGLFIYGTNQKDLQQLVPSIPYVGLNVSVLSDSSLYDDFLFRVLGDDINGVIIATYFNKDDFGILEKDIYDRFIDRYNHTLDQMSVLGIDAYNLAFEGIRRSAGIGGDDLVRSLLSIDAYDGLCGNIEVTGDGDVKKEIFLYKIEDNKPHKLKVESDGKNIVEI